MVAVDAAVHVLKMFRKVDSLSPLSLCDYSYLGEYLTLRLSTLQRDKKFELCVLFCTV